MLEPSQKTIAGSIGYGNGGLGQHLAQIIEEAREESTLARYYAPLIKPGDQRVGCVVRERISPLLFRYTPVRSSAGWKSHFGNELFDHAVAVNLAQGGTYVGFVGQSLKSFRRARQIGYRALELEAANSHVRNVTQQHAKAFLKHGIESESWLNEAQCRKTEHEYQTADKIVVCSEYTRQTFLARGFPEEKLSLRRLATHSRFCPASERINDGVFRVVYTGSLTVVKGIPVLLDAFSRLQGPAELTLIGGWASGGMRRYLLERIAQDPRIRLAPGDPLPYLQCANVYVHPTYEDGYAYAPMEALACGVPVIVTEDTGMKEHVREGVNGYVVPTGNWEAVLERLQHLRQTPLRAATGDLASR